MQGEGNTPDHAAIILAAHQPWIDDPSGGKGADHPSDADLPQIVIHLHFGEDGAMRMHGIGFLHRRVGSGVAATLDLMEAGSAEDVGVAFAAAFIIAAEEAAAALGCAAPLDALRRRARRHEKRHVGRSGADRARPFRTLRLLVRTPDETAAALMDLADAGEIRTDISPEDLLRALIGMCSMHDQPGWQARVLRLVDVFVDGLRAPPGQKGL